MEDEAPITKQQLHGLDEKLDRLHASSSKSNDVVLKAFLDTALE